jgi:formyl-CoA transferase
VLHHAPPALGEHTNAVLAELGLDAAAIAQLRQSGVV